MSAELIINGDFFETRVALVENGQVAEFYIERSSDRGIGSNIYKGRVVRVLPGMQAAFVDINLEKAAFLYVSDIHHPMGEIEEVLLNACEVGGEEANVEEPSEPAEEELSDALYLQRNHVEIPIEDRLQEGQDILVQVAKEPIGNKGARITTHITLAGRHLVLMPTMDHVGVSRRIENEKERKRLRDLMCTIKPPHCGFIVRTVAEGAEPEKLEAEVDFLMKLWENIQRRAEQAAVPSMVYQELDITLRAVRDLFTKEVDRLIIDSESEYRKILNFTETFMPSLKNAVELYQGEEPIFDAYGIEMEVQRALSRKIWLKSGGYIVIERTEALTAIDVNTGRYVGKRNLEETILKTNLEAVKEIAYQLRLRNIGGIIIIDFIDMEKESNREKVCNALKDAMRKDKSKTNILNMSELGLIEMTRKRTKESIGQILCEPCFYCDGEGYLKSKQTVCYEILRELQRDHRDLFGRNILVVVHPEVAARFYDEERVPLEKMEERLHASIVVKGDSTYHLDQYDVTVLEPSSEG
ncbi:Rne/Rng family ribonuclease [Desulforhabdus amnigena]|jgi:ribonuclease G|uniref:Ribonuclease G n=1 Tax=Desulforhabdus amnigena TaxID=40218 RepID=A0A9W6FSL0_9BACT|nr:Rne/Rng family ribonuclease [Desulforhabdus amnigena]NLJ27357.1 Rne/Rng family ribonuclease [Deltaproteobacteria bacterium]GLI34712.1 ribonuclease G [Desulforhabdus amnigena]